MGSTGVKQKKWLKLHPPLEPQAMCPLQLQDYSILLCNFIYFLELALSYLTCLEAD